ncbi:hypothetical protein L7F22_014705 [Adiantum nelumboides]|nr:hypothetical protein [Adiantum nelumboides]
MKAGLVPDCVGTDPSTMDESTELCRAWGKVKDQEALIFFDGGAKANFISPELPARLEITPDRMGPPTEAVLAAPGRDVAITPVIGKLRLHCQGYLGHEDFYIMPLEGCDVLLGIPWRNRGRLQCFQEAGWELVLVDLRNHGNSAGLKHLSPPHSIRAAAMDLADLVRSELRKWPDAVIGHSLGGKVALEFGESCANGRFGPSAVNPSQIWVLDSVPGKLDIEQNGEVERVLKTIQELPNPLPSRRWLVERLVEGGFSKSLADWLGTNLKRIEPSNEQMTWIFDAEGIYDMYLSYKQTDYWPFLECPPKGLDIGIVRAEKSDRWHPSLLSKLEGLGTAIKTSKPDQGRVSYHVLERAGHWLHIDNPKGLIEILAPSLVKLSCQLP